MTTPLKLNNDRGWGEWKSNKQHQHGQNKESTEIEEIRIFSDTYEKFEIREISIATETDEIVEAHLS